jgi:hypothetical protein
MRAAFDHNTIFNILDRKNFIGIAMNMDYRLIRLRPIPQYHLLYGPFQIVLVANR